jgi:hypothetical protein
MQVHLIRDKLSNNINDVEANRTYAILRSLNGKISRHGHVNSYFMNFARWNEGDVYHVTKAELDLIPLGIPIPHALTHRGGVINTTTGNIYLVLDHDIRALPSGPEVLNLFDIHSGNITSNVAEEWITILEKKIPVPNIYHENSLVRAHNSTQVYAIMNETKRAINSASIFFAHGWEFSNVIVVMDISDMDRIPFGSPL